MPRRRVLGKLPAGLDPPLNYISAFHGQLGLNSCFSCMLALDVMTPSWDFIASWTTHVKTTFSSSASRAGWGLDKLTRTLS